MHSPWTVFINLSIATLLGTAAYVGEGDSSVFARYAANNPAPAEVLQPVTIAAAESVQPVKYVAPATEAGPIILASAEAAPVAEVTEAEELVSRANDSVADPLPGLSVAVVTAELVNLRLGPSTDFEKIGTAAFGQELVLTGLREGTWVQVQHPVDGSPVWIAEKFIR